MTTLTTAHDQWRNRPDDERYVSLDEMYDYKRLVRERMSTQVVSNKRLAAWPHEDSNNRLVVVDNDEGLYCDPTNWSFGQLCQLADMPASTMRKLPSPIAADCINYGLRYIRNVEEVGTYKNVHDITYASFNGPNYGRVYDDDIINMTRNRFGNGVDGEWRIPGEFGVAVVPTKENTTLYASDRDMFIFLADEERRIEIPNRRDGKSGSLARGFFVRNSEVGAASLMLDFFTFDYVCCNRMVWGVNEHETLRVRHTKGAPDRWLMEMLPVLDEYSKSSTKSIQDAIHNAQAHKLDDVDAFLATRFGVRMASTLKLAHVASEGRPIVSLWDATTAATEFAKTIQHQDARVELERTAGALLRKAA